MSMLSPTDSGAVSSTYAGRIGRENETVKHPAAVARLLEEAGMLGLPVPQVNAGMLASAQAPRVPVMSEASRKFADEQKRLMQVHVRHAAAVKLADEIGSREALVQAHTAHAEAACRANEADEAAGRGRAASEAAEAALADFAKVDGDIAAHRATALRSGDITGLPAVLSARRRRQAEAQVEAEDASRTVALLDREAAANREVEKEARQAVAIAIVVVQIEIGEQAAARVRKLEAEAAQLRVLVAEMNAILLWSDQYGSQLAPTVSGLFRDGQHELLCQASMLTPRQARASWTDFTRALREDPQAPIPAEFSLDGAA